MGDADAARKTFLLHHDRVSASLGSRMARVKHVSDEHGNTVSVPTDERDDDGVHTCNVVGPSKQFARALAVGESAR